MKKSRLSLTILLIAAMMLSILPGFTAQAALGMQSFAFSDTALKRDGGYSVVEGVNFDNPFTSVDLTYRTGSYGTMVINVRLDSPAGPSIGTFELTEADRAGYTAWTHRTDRIPVLTDATGLHDVYFYLTTGEITYHNATFYYFEGSTTLYKPYGETNKSYNGFENPHKINFLESLGIMNTADEGFDADVPVSRIEYLKALSGFFDISELPEVPVGIFMDIDNAEDRQIAYFMYLKGAIVLEDTGYLKPHVYITPQEAAEYAANMLGYAGDFKVISKLKAGKTPADGYIRPAQMADILYNTAFHNYKVGYKTKSGALWYEEYDKFFLNYTKGYEMGEGLVTATSYTSIYSADDTVADNNVRINDIDYAIGETNADEMLGVYSYYVYETDDSGIETIKAIAPKFPENITELDSSLTFTEISSNKVEYINEKGKKQEIKLQASTKIIYNGKALDVEIDSVITDPANFRGRMALIDNNRDKVCDTLVIMNAKSLVINGVSEKGISSLSDAQDYTFEDDARAEFVRNDKIANAVDFNKFECVDIYESKSTKGSKLYKIVYSPNTIEATLIGKDSEGNLLFDDGTSNHVYSQAVYDSLYVGDIGTFFINNFGQVVYFKAVADNELRIGWIYKFNYNDDEEISFARFMTTDNKIERHQFAERVYVDGVRIKDYSSLKTALQAAETYMNGINTSDALTEADLSRPILYKLDENGLITVIDTIQQLQSPVTKYDSLKYILNSGDYRYTGGHIWTGQNLDINPTSAFTKGGTIFFGISSLGNERDAFSTALPGSATDLRNLSGYTYGSQDSKGIDILASNTISAGGGGNTSLKPFVITEKELVVNSDEEIVTKFTGMSFEGAVQGVTSATHAETDPAYAAMVDVLEPGDMMAATTLPGGIIDKIYVCHFEGNTYEVLDFKITASNGTDVYPILKKTAYSSSDTSHPDYDAGRWGEIKRLSEVLGGIDYNFIISIGKINSVGEDYIAIDRINSGTTVIRQNDSSIKVVTVGANGMDIDASGNTGLLKPGQTVICFQNEGKFEAFYIYDSLN